MNAPIGSTDHESIREAIRDTDQAGPVSNRSPTNEPSDCAYTEELLASLEWAQSREYAGYDYADGMSSRLLTRLPIDNRWVNLVVQESAKRAPVNIRPVLQIPKRRSFKGCALFAGAELSAYELTGETVHLERAIALASWLWKSRRMDPIGWGHNHDLQWPDGKIPRNTPNIVSTTYVARVLLELAPWLDAAVVETVIEEVPVLIRDQLLIETSDGPRLRYDPLQTGDYFVLNVNALAGALLVEIADATDDSALRDLGTSLLDYVAAKQAPNGGWMYTDPPSYSHLSMDNHHNGFILESFLRYEAVTGNDRFSDVLDQGLSFYRTVLFNPDGSPNWDESNQYPRDSHAAAQGILTFTYANDRPFAEQILEWTLDELSGNEGRFYYRKGRLWTKRFTLMRWSQAWMTFAIGQYCCSSDVPWRPTMIEHPQTGWNRH